VPRTQARVKDLDVDKALSPASIASVRLVLSLDFTRANTGYDNHTSISPTKTGLRGPGSWIVSH
jgi:hypothetical protein